MADIFSFNTIIAGRILIETIINKKKQVSINKPGGSVLYAAAGFSLWKKKAGLIAKLSEKSSTDWVPEFEKFHFDVSGIKKTKESFEQRKFYSISQDDKILADNPQKIFSEINRPLPKTLLGYNPNQIDSKNRITPEPFSLQTDDFPKKYLQSNNLILCELDYYSHHLIPPFYRSLTNGNVILCASNSYMHPSFWFDIPTLLRGSTAFIATEDQVRNLFKGKNTNLWEMAEYFTQSGVEIVVFMNNTGSQYLCDSLAKKKYKLLNSFSAKIIDPVGSYAAFCGGFSAGFTTHFDPLRSFLMGSVSASINNEGSTPYHTINSLPDLCNARMEFLKDYLESV
jgi:hypothetical protein